jgi:hypothetical protein
VDCKFLNNGDQIEKELQHRGGKMHFPLIKKNNINNTIKPKLKLYISLDQSSWISSRRHIPLLNFQSNTPAASVSEEGEEDKQVQLLLIFFSLKYIAVSNYLVVQ